MKTRLLLALMLTLAFSILLSSCGIFGGDINATEDPFGGHEPVSWVLNESQDGAKMPNDAKTAFDDAFKNFEGSTVVPVVYLGSQSVAGTNYAYLCNVTPITKDATTEIKLVTVYSDVNKKATVGEFYDFDLTAIGNKETFGTNDEANVSGAWNTASKYDSVKLPEKVQKAYDEIVGGLEGSKIVPVAYLGSQKVAGMNYAVVTANTPITSADAQVTLNVAYLYVPPKGDGTVKFVPLNISEYVK